MTKTYVWKSVITLIGLGIFIFLAVGSDETPPADTTAPDTFIVDAPDTVYHTVGGDFYFSADEDNCTFEYAIGAGDWKPCLSPLHLRPDLEGLGEHRYTLKVRAVDAAGNRDGSPAEVGFVTRLKPANPWLHQVLSSIGYEPKNWLIMIYFAADNNLSDFADGDLEEIRKAGARNNVRLEVYIDQAAWGDTRYYRFAGDFRHAGRDTTVLDKNGQVLFRNREANFSDGDEMMHLIYNGLVPDWTLIDHVALILWDHGGGRQFGLCQDGNNMMSISELKRTLGKIERQMERRGMKEPRIDLLIFDACLMGSYDVALELTEYDFVKRIIASENTVPAYGLPYDQIFEYIKRAKPGPGRLGKFIVDSYFTTYYPACGNASLSMIDPSQVDAEARKNLSRAFRGLDFLERFAVMKKSAGDGPNFYRAQTFAELVALYADDEVSRAYARDFLRSFNKTVMYRRPNKRKDGLCIEEY
ncbi:hypothetical protein JXO52_05330 [bacterium]|nr:hypothetical protein [bacterium]